MRILRQAGIDIERDRVDIGPLPETSQPGVSFGVAAGRALADGKVEGLWANVLGCELAMHLGGGSGEGQPTQAEATLAVFSGARVGVQFKRRARGYTA